MVSSVAAYDAGLSGAASFKRGQSRDRSGFSALLAGGILAGLCAVLLLAALYDMAATPRDAFRFETTLTAPVGMPAALAPLSGHLVHIRKFSRLNGHGLAGRKGARVAGILQRPDAQNFADRAGAVGDGRESADAARIAVLKADDIVAAAIGRPVNTAAGRFSPAKHPALETALAMPDAAAGMIPDTVPLPAARPQRAVADTKPQQAAPAEIAAVEPLPRPRPTVAAPSAPVAAMAFARPDNPLRGPAVPWPDQDGATAIYDISAGAVYMPDGEVLEAHSGLGIMRDNPAFVHVKMRGATPPASYRLSLREAPFHGVEAIRLTPENGINPHGRDGLLAHTYMLARRGESNGCVVFKQYERFLSAFKHGAIRRMVVVPKREAKPTLADNRRKGGAKTLAELLF